MLNESSVGEWTPSLMRWDEIGKSTSDMLRFSRIGVMYSLVERH